MEVIAFSVLSAVIINSICIVSFIFYKRFKKNDSAEVPKDSRMTVSITPKKANRIKKTPKYNQVKKKAHHPDDDTSGTENYTTEEQLAKTILRHQKFSRDSINTSALDEKSSAKRSKEPVKSTTSRIPLPTFPEERWSSDWENVTCKRKKKFYTVTELDDRFQFTLDGFGGIVELPFCEIHFPAECVREPLLVSVQTETYEKFVDDAEDKVFVTPAVHFVTTGDGLLMRRFVLKLHSMKMLGRGWDGKVCCQIERKDAGSSWTAVGRTEFLQGMPVTITGDCLRSFRAVITRVQSGEISRNLNIAAYLTKPKVSNPKYHYLHICIYDNSQQTLFKVHNNMQKLLLKMQPKLCNIPFGCNVEFQLEPTLKYTLDEKEIFMRWSEVCKAFVNVRFQIRLNRNESVDPDFEPQIRTMVFLTVNKVGTTQTWKQREYFYFYWISGNIYPKRQKYGSQRTASTASEKSKISDDDGFASGSDLCQDSENTYLKQISDVNANSHMQKYSVTKLAAKANRPKNMSSQVFSSATESAIKSKGSSHAKSKPPKTVRARKDMAAQKVTKQSGMDLKRTAQIKDAKVVNENSSHTKSNTRKKPNAVKQRATETSIVNPPKELDSQPKPRRVKRNARLSRNHSHANSG